jgi:acyl carrier protein
MPSDAFSAVSAAIATVLRDTGRSPRPLTASSLLSAEIGLDSLDLAQTVVILERTLSVDPFRTAPAEGDRRAIRTVGDLVSLYERAIAEASNQHTIQAEFSERVSEK